MRRAQVVALAAASLLAIAGCSGPDATPTQGSTDLETVGTLGIQTRAPEPTPTPSVPPPAVSENISADPSPPADSHDIFDEAHEEPPEVLEAHCEALGEWWGSALHTTHAKWIAAGGDRFISDRTVTGYDEATFNALRDTNWDRFEVLANKIPASGYGSCIVFRGSESGKHTDVEAVIFTFMSIDPPVPGTMRYQKSGSITRAKMTAEESMTR